MYKVIATGSTGNAVLYHGNILVDCGVSFSKIEPYLYDIDLLLLTHVHGDHFNLATIKRLQFERPSLRIGCGEWMVEHLEGLKNIDVYKFGALYEYGSVQISPIKLYHDVENFGYRIFKGDHKTIHCTDTGHLEGITAKGYDLYAIEHNYNDETIRESIYQSDSIGEYSHQRGSFNSHLSEQQARDFIFKNKGENCEILRLHESSTS
jgi:L-ascorbate metabolism protein UlaG (beta-lactamase superfamily)